MTYRYDRSTGSAHGAPLYKFWDLCVSVWLCVHLYAEKLSDGLTHVTYTHQLFIQLQVCIPSIRCGNESMELRISNCSTTLTFEACIRTFVQLLHSITIYSQFFHLFSLKKNCAIETIVAATSLSKIMSAGMRRLFLAPRRTSWALRTLRTRRNETDSLI